MQKKEDSVSSLWDSKRSNICITGVPEGEEEKEQEIGDLFEKIMKENIPNVMKEIDMQVQEAQRVPNEMDAKKPTPRHIIIKMPKVKSSERQAVRFIYKGVTARLSANFTKETAGQKGLARNIQSHEKLGPTAKIALPSKAVIQNRRTDKELPRQEKSKGLHHHQTITI